MSLSQRSEKKRQSLGPYQLTSSISIVKTKKLGNCSYHEDPDWIEFEALQEKSGTALEILWRFLNRYYLLTQFETIGRILSRSNFSYLRPSDQLSYLIRHQDAGEGVWLKARSMYILFANIFNAYALSKFSLAAILVFLQGQSRGRQLQSTKEYGEILSYYLTGQLFAETPDLGEFVLLAALGSLLCSLLMRFLFRTSLTNATSVRLLFNPRVELERLRQMAEVKVNLSLGSIVNSMPGGFDASETKNVELHSLEHSANYRNFRASRLRWRLSERVQTELKIVQRVRARFWDLRPSSYGYTAYRSLVRQWRFVLATILVSNAAIYLVIMLMLAYSYTRRSAKLAERQLVYPQSALNPPVLLLVIDVNLIGVIMYSSITGSMVTLIMQIIHQHRTVAWIERVLVRCRFEMSRHLMSHRLNSDQHIEVFYASLLKYWIYTEDSSHSRIVISAYATFVCTLGISISVAAGVASRLRDTTRLDITTLVYLVIWSYNNLFLLACASIPARVEKTKRLVWSLVALAAESSAQQADRSLIHEPVFQMWHKIVVSEHFKLHHSSSNVFGRDLDYSEALRLNYVFVSFALILWSRSSR